jgi:DNA-binding MurR/RpiR family transcriptional regulator
MEVTAESLEGPADILAKAERIHIVGSRRAYPVATYLTYALAQLGLKVHLLDGAGGMLTQQATAFEKDDVLIAISFQPYAPETVSVAAKAQEAGMQIVAITDGPLSPLLHMAAASFEIEETSVGAFRALSATMCLALALVVTTGEHADLKSDMSSLLS